MTDTIDIAANLISIRERTAAAARRAGRAPDEVMLLAVSKTHPVALIEQALAAGQRDFGENMVEEAWAKFGDPKSTTALEVPPSSSELLRVPLSSSELLRVPLSSSELLRVPLSSSGLPQVPPGLPESISRPRLHLIGPIQSRKAALAVACRPALIHAVDRLKIARRLDRFAAEAGLVLEVLLEVNVAGEASKFGFTPEAVGREAEAILALPHLRVRGLMTIPPYVPDPQAARPHFAALHGLRDQLAQRYPQADWRTLSMGMSHDFETAIEEGATIVRVGTAIFGSREA